MTEYEEITEGKTTEELIEELNYQLKEGFSLTDSFPQYLLDIIHKLNPTKRQVYIKFEGVDDWGRPVYKYINNKIYIGSTNHLLPNKQISPNDNIKEINDFFKQHTETLVYFGDKFNCEPDGREFKKNIQFIILDV